MNNKSLKEISEIRFCLVPKESLEKKCKVLTPLNLLENNIIQEITFDDKVKIDETTKISNGDIIIKRIMPSFVNYIDNIDEDVYATGNLIIIKAISVDAKYLACILNKSIRRLTQSLSGATVPAVGRSDLEALQVPIISEEKQKAIGEIWYKSLEIYKLKTRLNDLEFLRTTTQINDLINEGK